MTVWYERPSCRSTILVSKYRASHVSADPDSVSCDSVETHGLHHLPLPNTPSRDQTGMLTKFVAGDARVEMVVIHVDEAAFKHI